MSKIKDVSKNILENDADCDYHRKKLIDFVDEFPISDDDKKSVKDLITKENLKQVAWDNLKRNKK